MITKTKQEATKANELYLELGINGYQTIFKDELPIAEVFDENDAVNILKVLNAHDKLVELLSDTALQLQYAIEGLPLEKLSVNMGITLAKAQQALAKAGE